MNNIDYFEFTKKDYDHIVEEAMLDEEFALKLAYDWLNDEDAIEDKLYCYWKNIVKK